VTKLLEKALEAVRRLSPDDQDEILAQAKRREFASDSEVEAAFHRFDR
jgi:hypothetical protein